MRRENFSEWKIAVIGAGTMGLCIAQYFAMHGHTVNLYNRTAENLEKAVKRIHDNLITLTECDMMDKADVDKAMANVKPTGDIETAVSDADYIIENVAEKVEVKTDIFAKIDKYAKPDAIIGSDTSSMDIYKFINISNSERLIITHFFNPAYVMPLVEVVKGEKTSDETVNVIKAFLEDAGKTPAVLNKVVPGFIINRFSAALSREACYMVEQGMCSFEDIDKAIVATYGPRFTFEGPGQLGDFVGLDVSAFVFSNLFPTLSDAKAPSPVLLNMVKEGKLGVKSGEGLGGKYDDPVKAYNERDTKVIKMIKAINDVNKSMK